MNCQHVERLLSDDLDGLLSSRQASAVAAHLGNCPACRHLRANIRTVEAEYRMLADQLCIPDSDLEQRAIERWTTRGEGPQRSRPAVRTGWDRVSGALLLLLLPWRRMPAAIAAAFLLLAALGLLRARWGDQPIKQAGMPPIRSRPQPQTFPPGSPLPLRSCPQLARKVVRNRPTRLTTTPAAPAGRDLLRLPTATPVNDPKPGRIDRRPLSRAHTPGPIADDLVSMNRDPQAAAQQWAPLTRDEWERIEAQVRRAIHVHDDFVTIPFPRIASISDRAITQAVESYKREAAIVDPRLSREVTCAFKGTALSDLCEQLKQETGIELTAGPSVADEKITVFCEKMPLREVMRQLSRPFGYTWLRSRKEGGDYKYELVQDLRSQLLEEELRNRDRDAALIALEEEINRYRPYLDLSPDEAMERAKAAPPEEKKLLEKLSRTGWGPIQLYFRLSPPELAALRAGQRLKFGYDPRPDDPPGAVAQPLPPDIARGVLQSMREKRLQKQEDGYVFVNRQDAAFAISLLPSAVPEALAHVDLSLDRSELGQLTLNGMSGFGIAGSKMFTGNSDAPYAVGISPTALQPDNAAINAGLEGEPDMRRRFTVQPQSSCGADHAGTKRGEKTSPSVQGASSNAGRASPSGGGRQPEPKDNSADVLEALHQATGLPIVADFYTHLYRAEDVSQRDQPLFQLLNHLSDAMRLRWHKDTRAGDRSPAPNPVPSTPTFWLRFRSVSFYNDRLKEVPNRLLARWAAARRERGALTLDELLEIAQLSDAQLDAADMAEGARECWGLGEWDMARGRFQRPHLRFLAQLTPEQRQEALGADGLAFSRMSLAQQQFLALRDDPRVRSLEELAGATLRVGYTQPGGFQWNVPEEELALPGRGVLGLSPVHEPTRAMAVQAARRIDPGVDPAQIGPTELALTVVYTLGSPTTGLHEVALQVTAADVRMWGHDYPAQRGAPAGGG